MFALRVVLKTCKGVEVFPGFRRNPAHPIAGNNLILFTKGSKKTVRLHEIGFRFIFLRIKFGVAELNINFVTGNKVGVFFIFG